MAGLDGKEDRLTGELPGGWKQRLALACAVLHRPRVVFLDEPTAASTRSRGARFWRLIDEMAAAGVTVFVTTHYLDEAEHCHRLALMHAGRLVALGTVSELKQVFAGNARARGRRARASARRSRRSRAQPWALETSVFGTRLHVVVRDAGEGRREAVRLLAGAGNAAVSRRAHRAVARGRLHPPRRAGGGGAPRRRAGRAMRRLRAVVVKELRQVRRDPLSLAMLIGLPAFMLVLYGFALNFDVRHVRLAVQDLDRSAASRELVASFTHSTYFDLVATPGAGEDLDALLERRVAQAVLVIPEGYGPTSRPAAARRSSCCSTAPTRTPPPPCSATPRALVAEQNLAIQAEALRRAGSRARRRPRLRAAGLLQPRARARRSSWCRG